MRYSFDVFKYYYKFCKEFEKEKYFYNIYIDDDVIVTLKVDKLTGVVVNNIYTSGFIPDSLFFHVNKKILAIGNGSQDYFYYLSFLYTL